MFKSIIKNVMCFLLVASLVACGGGGVSTSSSNAKSGKSKLKQEYVFYEREGKTYFSDLKNEYLLCDDTIEGESNYNAVTGDDEHTYHLYLNEANNCLIYQKDSENEWFIKDLSKIDSDDMNLGISNVELIIGGYIVYESSSDYGTKHGISVFNIKNKTKERIIDDTASDIRIKKISNSEFIYYWYWHDYDSDSYEIKFGKYNLNAKTLQESEIIKSDEGGHIVLECLDYPFSAIMVTNGGNREEYFNGAVEKLYRFSFDKGFEFIDEQLRECQYEFNESYKNGAWTWHQKTGIYCHNPYYYAKMIERSDIRGIFELYYSDGISNTFLGEGRLDLGSRANHFTNLKIPVSNMSYIGSDSWEDGFLIRDKIYKNKSIVTSSNDGNKILIVDKTNDYRHREYFIVDINTEEKKYIDNDVNPIYFDGNNLLYVNKDKNELKLNDKVIGSDHSDTWVRYNSDLDIIAFCCNNTLSVYKDDETKMVAGNVKDFELTKKDSICYLTNNNELYIYDYGDEPQKICNCEHLLNYEVIR